MLKLKLKYRFVANYSDGETYFQNEDDASVKLEGKNCFFDVEQDRLSSFELCGLDGNTFGVSLLDGHFEANGVPFRMYDEALSDFKLIYFRRNTLHFNSNMEELGNEVSYRLGWQAKDGSGKNVTRIMEIG